jgi:hypothetical protein
MEKEENFVVLCFQKKNYITTEDVLKESVCIENSNSQFWTDIEEDIPKTSTVWDMLMFMKEKNWGGSGVNEIARAIEEWTETRVGLRKESAYTIWGYGHLEQAQVFCIGTEYD